MSLDLELSKPIEHIVFDLDDTLLDTYTQLIPRATKDACIAMIAAGLKADLDVAIEACQERAASTPRRDLFTSLVRKFGVKPGHDPLRIATAGNQAFYNRKVEPDITLFDGARDLLQKLTEKGYVLHLVTQGYRLTQEEKVTILKIARYFDSISFIDPSKGERKQSAFAQIQKQSTRPPETHLSIGNRIDTDIAEAKELGWKTCWVRYGEYKHLTPALPAEKPDFTITSLNELVSACRL